MGSSVLTKGNTCIPMRVSRSRYCLQNPKEWGYDIRMMSSRVDILDESTAPCLFKSSAPDSTHKTVLTITSCHKKPTVLLLKPKLPSLKLFPKKILLEARSLE